MPATNWPSDASLELGSLPGIPQTDRWRLAKKTAGEVQPVSKFLTGPKLAALEQELKARLDIHEVAIVDILQRIMRILDPPPKPPPPPEPPPPPGNNTDSRAWRPKRDSREDVIAAVRELMGLGPNDPAPVPPPIEKPAAKPGAKPEAAADEESEDAQ